MLSEAAKQWLKTGERGCSSEAIFEVLTGIPISQYSSHPLDPDDFKRCEKLLREVPEFRTRLLEIKSLSTIWRNLVEKWPEIVSLMESEVPGVFDNPWIRGSAPKTYDFMKSLGC